jgi:hypothetical protein
MFRILFWTLVAAGLGGFFWFAANSKHMTADQNQLVWTLIVDLVIIAFTAYGIGMLVYGFKTRSVIMAGGHPAKARAFSRETQPIRYWLVMAFYVCWIFGCLSAFYALNRELVQML